MNFLPMKLASNVVINLSHLLVCRLQPRSEERVHSFLLHIMKSCYVHVLFGRGKLFDGILFLVDFSLLLLNQILEHLVLGLHSSSGRLLPFHLPAWLPLSENLPAVLL